MKRIIKIVSIILILTYLMGCTNVHYIDPDKKDDLKLRINSIGDDDRKRIILKDGEEHYTKDVYTEGDTVIWVGNSDHKYYKTNIDDIRGVGVTDVRSGCIKGAGLGTVSGCIISWALLPFVFEQSHSIGEFFDETADYARTAYITTILSAMLGTYLGMSSEEEVYMLRENIENAENIETDAK